MKWGPMKDEPPSREVMDREPPYAGEPHMGPCRLGAVEEKPDVSLIADLVDWLASKHPRDGVHIWVCQCEFARTWRALTRLQEVGLGKSPEDVAAAREKRRMMFGLDCE